jgi:hypothetical protein
VAGVEDGSLGFHATEPGRTEHHLRFRLLATLLTALELTVVRDELEACSRLPRRACSRHNPSALSRRSGFIERAAIAMRR